MRGQAGRRKVLTCVMRQKCRSGRRAGPAQGCSHCEPGLAYLCLTGRARAIHSSHGTSWENEARQSGEWEAGQGQGVKAGEKSCISKTRGKSVASGPVSRQPG